MFRQKALFITFPTTAIRDVYLMVNYRKILITLWFRMLN